MDLRKPQSLLFTITLTIRIFRGDRTILQTPAAGQQFE
jgi:hypothetical protein